MRMKPSPDAIRGRGRKFWPRGRVGLEELTSLVQRPKKRSGNFPFLSYQLGWVDERKEGVFKLKAGMLTRPWKSEAEVEAT